MEYDIYGNAARQGGKGNPPKPTGWSRLLCLRLGQVCDHAMRSLVPNLKRPL
jgi:hypothetical protein